MATSADDGRAWRADFPIFERPVQGKPLVYLDSAATTQKPRPVIEAVSRFYGEECANVHRGVHTLSAQATRHYEAVRERVAGWLGASLDEIVFTSGATGGINLVAHAFGQRYVQAGDEILVTAMEHHSNLVPWQLLCERSGASLRAVPIDDRGELVLEEFGECLGPRTRLVAITHTSNALGTCNPLELLIPEAHRKGIPVLVDAAQAMAHERLDVRRLDCDFLVFSGHKMFGPTGIGVLYGKRERLVELPPFLGGGEMIDRVRLTGTTFKAPPHRFEAGTPNIAGVLGLGAAVDWLDAADLERIGPHDAELLDYATRRLAAISRVRVIGTARRKSAVLSFTVEGIHPHDVAQWLDGAGVAVRAGHHCAQPAMEHYGLSATVRASFACYNTRQDVDTLVRGLEDAIEVLG